jgi:hypothetical protein
MSGIPATCSHCDRAFTTDGHGVRLAHLEFGRALCDLCFWLVEHPETSTRRRPSEEQPAA